MYCCSYSNCNQRRLPCSSVSWFTLPKDARREVWIKHSDIKEEISRESNIIICEEHFYRSDLVPKSVGYRLKKSAVPKSCVDCECDDKSVKGTCADLLARASGSGLRDNMKGSQKPQQKTLQKMALTGDYIPLNANADTSPKAGPSRVKEKSSPQKRPREEDSDDDEPLSVTKAKATRSYGKRTTVFTSAIEKLRKFAKEDGVCDSTTQIDGEKEIAVDVVKEEGDDPLDCSDVVLVSAYPNVTPRDVVHPASEDDSVEIIPMLDDEESEGEVVEVPTTEDSVIIVEDESDISAHVRIPSPKKGKKKKSKGGGKPTPPRGSNTKKQLPVAQQASPKAPNPPNPPSKIRIVKENSSSTEKRPRFIVIDGSNVAFHHSLMKKVFSVEGLQIAIQYFEEKGHEVVAVVPVFRSKMRYSTNPAMLRDLNLKGKVIFSPAKNINGHTLSSYDDLLIMQVAEKNKGVIISNDNFADLLGQNIAWDTIIGSRVIGFTWFKDQFFLPLDPYGRDGPKINDILYY